MKWFVFSNKNILSTACSALQRASWNSRCKLLVFPSNRLAVFCSYKTGNKVSAQRANHGRRLTLASGAISTIVAAKSSRRFKIACGPNFPSIVVASTFYRFKEVPFGKRF
jgi:hypothetical protein